MEISEVLQIVGQMHLRGIETERQLAQKDMTIDKLVADNNALTEKLNAVTKDKVVDKGDVAPKLLPFENVANEG